MRPLILHKTEWDRLKNQAEPPEEPKHEIKHFNALMDTSKSGIGTCPDAEQGHVMQITKHKKNQQENKNMTIGRVNTVKIKQSNEAIKKARQQIFEDSCYGERLISALMESKTLEERQVQIQFKKELQQKALQEEDKSNKISYCSFNLDEKEAEFKHLQKMNSVQCSLTNKNMQKIKIDEIAMNREKYQQLEQEDARLMEQLLIKEAYQEENLKQMEKQALKEHSIEQDNVKKQRMLREHQDEVNTELCRKNQQRLKCKIQYVFKQIHGDRQNKSTHRNVYKQIGNCQLERENRYHFIDNRIKEREQQILKKDKAVTELSKRERVTPESNTNVYEENQKKCKCDDTKFKWSVCDRQCLIPQSHKYGKKIGCDRVTKKDEERQPSFLKPRNKLLEDLKKREKEQSSWSGANTAHEQFVFQANEILLQCRYKTLARKVVDDYRRLNCLDSSTLPISHY